MKKSISIFLLLALVFFGGCSDSDDGPDKPKGQLFLSADKLAILANGEDQTTFKVVDQEGADVTTAALFKINGEVHPGSTFSTTLAGKYKVVASVEELQSDEIEVLAASEEVDLEISADKKSLISDGGDLVRLSLTDKLGNDLTALNGEFFVDGNPIEGRYFKTTVAGIHQITARWNGKNVEGTLSLGAFASAPFENRVLVESFTATSCVYCQPVIEIIPPLARENSQVVLVELHWSGIWNTSNTSKAQSDVKELGKYYGVGGTPSVYINREQGRWMPEKGKEGILRKLKAESKVAIALETEVKEGEVKVKAILKSLEALNGKVGTILVENGIFAEQYGIGNMEMYRMMRSYIPNTSGNEISLEAGKLKTVEFSIPLSPCVEKNCWVIVYVLGAEGIVENVQQTAIGINIGY